MTGVHHPDPFDAYDAREVDEWAALPYPRPRKPRCGRCGYRADALGHLKKCETK